MTRRLLALLLAAATAGTAPARTVVLTDQDTERMAVLSAAAPDVSWAAYELFPGGFTGKYTLNLTPSKTFLLAFPLGGIPRGQRITAAEFLLPVNAVGSEQRVTVRRVLADWGAGVSHKYRTQRPAPAEWARPGATGASDRAAKATAVLKVDAAGEKAVNVTEDVELWYGGAAANHGWAVTVEDTYGSIQFLSPLSTYPNGAGSWKLRITYEPE